MASERELLNVAERCRLCLLDNGFMISLHDELVETKLKDLTKCTCIDIKQEKHLPHSVCHICLYKLNMWTEFKEQFIQSNRTLFKQLEITDMFDDTIKDSAQNEEGSTKIVKRKRLYQSSEDSNFDIDKKKSKLDPPAPVDSAASQFILDTIYITDNDDVEPASSKDSSQKVLDILDNSKEKDAENGSEEHTEDKSSLEPRRARLLPAKRGRNIKRRKASTKRWVERKKALFAATGENVSDSDSIVSDDEKLTPAQKARAKTNEDKEAERQKRIAKVLKDLEMNTADSDTCITRLRNLKDLEMNTADSDTCITRLRNAIDNGIEIDTSLSMESSMEQISSVGNNITANGARKIESQADETFVPQSSKTELMIGDTKFIVTSQLIPGDSSYFNEETLNDLMRTPKGANIDGSNQEKNTDIIDAVQLRRVNPVVFNANSKFVKRCLDIRIEGHEWLVLKRVQTGLSDFIQKEVKYNLLGVNGDAVKNDKINANSCQDLDQKLKDLIQKTIQKNVELSTVRDTDSAWDEEPVISPKKIVSSPEYQPKVVMKRLNVTKESEVYNINNSHTLTPTSRKRQSVLPIKYNDYSTALDSDSMESDDMVVQEIPKTTNPRTYRNLAKRLPGVNSQIANVRIMDNVETIKTVDSSATSLPLLTGQESLNEQKIDYEDANKIEGVIAENHICGVCGLTFNSRKDVEAHVRAHKAAARASSATQVVSQSESTPTPPQPNKQKKMRCKRCHEIVEACYVKAHAFMCKMKTGIYKCYVCNSSFTTQALLVQHLETHDQSEFDVTKTIDNKKLSNADTLQQTQSVASQQKKMQNILMKKSDILSDKITSVKSDGSKTEEKSKETYNCFLCDKIFTDEEVLKDHLQKHCDDLSEGEENSSKEQYQCAICGDTLESDQALEEHVSKHLFNDEDNTNLINVNQDNEDTAKSNKHKIYHCDQCSITFNSETSLKTHAKTHIQEVTTEKYQQDSTVIYQYQCTLCEELFDAEEEMAEHLELHNGDAQVCQLCDKPFRTLEELQEHVATH
ncbi:uncharacterized protein [Linepithema humile]|uniref:uncharacterized protein n=1 Tax=Linepithema humile TaxID=83485 RepID=UPI000623A0FA|nr:PREDICTED: uncharacterized protein LOC105673615 [Linepithema humile]